MAQISMPPIPMKMYRHFAVVTLLLTGTLAMLANDSAERQGAAAVAENGATGTAADGSELVDSAASNVAIDGQMAPAGGGGPAYGSGEITRRNGTRTQYRDNEIYDDNFGEPTDDSANAGRSSSINPYAQPIIPGYSQAYLDSLTEEQRRVLLEQVQAANEVPPAVRRLQAPALESTMYSLTGSGSGVE